MDYSSSLGPLDPQIIRSNGNVSALGVLDKYNELYNVQRQLSQTEQFLLNKIDLADIRAFEQSREIIDEN